MSKIKIIGLIPSRYGSTRLPGKPLKMILGKSLIQRCYEQAIQAKLLDSVYVVTDDERIFNVVKDFGGKAIMTRIDHISGTDRIAEAAQSIDADIIVNIQGDQPFFDPLMVEEGIQSLLEDATLEMSTLKYPISNPEDFQNTAVVKVVTDIKDIALYFSRSLIPYAREDTGCPVYEHIGLYIYRRDFLLKLSQLEPTPLELTESLEQLRVLEYGYRLHVPTTKCKDKAFSGFSVDTFADLERAIAMLKERGLK